LMEIYIERKFQLSTCSHFGVIRKTVKTWTPLPEKLLIKKQRNSQRARAMSQLWQCWKFNWHYWQTL